MYKWQNIKCGVQRVVEFHSIQGISPSSPPPPCEGMTLSRRLQMSPHPSGKKKQGRGSQPEPERRKRRQQISKTRGGGKDAEKLLRRGEETFEEFRRKRRKWTHFRLLPPFLAPPSLQSRLQRRIPQRNLGPGRRGGSRLLFLGILRETKAF